MAHDPPDPEALGPVALGRIPLKQVRVRKEPESSDGKSARNRLVPYLDLFARLDDSELARLAEVAVDVVAALRRQVIEVCTSLEHYRDLLPRLSDDELARLTGASSKTVRFWRLCQRRDPQETAVPRPVVDEPSVPIAEPAAEGDGEATEPSAG